MAYAATRHGITQVFFWMRDSCSVSIVGKSSKLAAFDDSAIARWICAASCKQNFIQKAPCVILILSCKLSTPFASLKTKQMGEPPDAVGGEFFVAHGKISRTAMHKRQRRSGFLLTRS